MTGWTSGNTFELLENGEEYFPAVFDAVRSAQREILLETFIWCEDETGTQLRQLMIDAAERGVNVRITVDGFGTPGFTPEFLEGFRAAGVRVDSFDPQPSMFGFRTNMLCRLHTKIVVVDGEIAFVGGINYGDIHLRSFGDQSKQDYAMSVRGPIVRHIQDYCKHGHTEPPGFWRRRWRYWLRRVPRELREPGDDAQAIFAIRDNDEHPTDIETLYRVGIRNARKRIIIANAYFFPGYRFVRELCKAARRGVDVQLIMQGEPDRPVTISAASIVYEDLLAAGVRICRYVERPLHAKVAVIDDRWATVGSSNLDPTSLGLNLEANLFVLDKSFNARLTASLQRLIDNHCEVLTTSEAMRPSRMRRLLLTLTYHLTRRMWSWGRRARFTDQQIRPMQPGQGVTAEAAE